MKWLIHIYFDIHCYIASATDHECKDFYQHLVNYKKVADIEESGHPFLLSLLGCVTTSEPNCIITEFCVHGDLLSYLLQMRQQVQIYHRFII